MKSDYELAEAIEQKKKMKEKRLEKINKSKGNVQEDGKLLLKVKQFGKSIDSISNCHTKTMALMKIPEFATLLALIYAFLLFPVIL